MTTLDEVKNDLVLDRGFKNLNRDAENQAQISYDKEGRGRIIERVTLDLSTAQSFSNPYFMRSPFDGFRVEEATDNNVSVKMAFSSNEAHQTMNFSTVKKDDVMTFGRRINSATLSWDAQSGKTITIVFLLDAKFQSGSLRQELSGGVTVTTGSGMTPQTKVTVAVTATLISASNTSRKKATIQNLGAADVYISGTNTVTLATGATPGIKITPNSTYEFIATGDIYGIADGVACSVSLNTEA